MKKVFVFIILAGIFHISNCITGAEEFPIPTTLNTLANKQPIELNVNLVIDGDNSKLEIGVVCNETLGKQTLFGHLMFYNFKKNIGPANWLENFIQKEWDPAQAIISFPAREGLEIDCKAGAIYHYEYPFKWQWDGTFNSICALVYMQNTKSKEVLAVKRSQNILLAEIKPIVPAERLSVTAGKESVYRYLISNSTQEQLTFETKAEASNLLWDVSLDKEVFYLSPGDYDTITLHLKTTLREQYGTVKLSVSPKFLKGVYSVPETHTLTENVITNAIEYLGVTDTDITDDYSSGTPVWFSFIRNGCYAQPETGTKWVFMTYNIWKTLYPEIDYKILYIFPKSGNNVSFGYDHEMEGAALECIEKGKNLIVSSDCGLSLNTGKFRDNGLLSTKEAAEFYNKLGIEFRGFINLYVAIEGTENPVLYKNDTLSIRVDEDNDLNMDVDGSNTIVNSGQVLSSRIDYIGITGENKKTFPFLWFNRKNEPQNSYAGVATVLGSSKIIYLSPGLETIGGVADTLLIRNFMKWIFDPSDVSESKSTVDLNISPNPAGDYITITLSGINPTLKPGVDELIIYNTLGEKVMTESIHPMTASHRMNIESLPRGIYFVKAGGETTKFVKM